MSTAMITPDYCRLMARYNRWQNRSLYTAAAGIGDPARREDRGAFFGNIHDTLAHILWGDSMWMSRFDGWDVPSGGIHDLKSFMPDWEELSAARADADQKIVTWADALTSDDLSGELSWFSGVTGKQMSKPKAPLVMHMFNHQTHHRGQTHAMLTMAGARPEATDIPFMPESEAGD